MPSRDRNEQPKENRKNQSFGVLRQHTCSRRVTFSRISRSGRWIYLPLMSQASHQMTCSSMFAYWNLWIVVYDILLLYAAGFLKPSAFSHYRWIRAMVISIAIIPFYRIRKQKEDYQPLPCAVSQLASTEAHPRPQPPPPTVACCHDKSSLLSTPYKTHV